MYVFVRQDYISLYTFKLGMYYYFIIVLIDLLITYIMSFVFGK